MHEPHTAPSIVAMQSIFCRPPRHLLSQYKLVCHVSVNSPLPLDMSPHGLQQRCGSVKPANNNNGLISGSRMKAITLRLPVRSARSLTSVCVCV